jgi:hypothetical protein
MAWPARPHPERHVVRSTQRSDIWAAFTLRPKPVPVASRAKVPRLERLKRLRQLNLSDLPGRLAEDNATFADSIRAVKNLSPSENTRQYADACQQYADTALMPPTWRPEN